MGWRLRETLKVGRKSYYERARKLMGDMTGTPNQENNTTEGRIKEEEIEKTPQDEREANLHSTVIFE